MKLIYAKSALRDLDDIRKYIAKDDPHAAERVVQRIMLVASRLESLPFLGRPGRRGARLLTVAGLPYVIIHRVRNDEVKIVAVFHTARDRGF
jgi:toxin ParE1/3/4